MERGAVGRKVGMDDGASDGRRLGEDDGVRDGSDEGDEVGVTVGEWVGKVSELRVMREHPETLLSMEVVLLMLVVKIVLND